MTLRSVILVGAGCKNSPRLIDYLGSLNIPILTTWMAIDFYDENHPSFCGRPGVYGGRCANIIQQKADVIVCIGARLDNEQIAYSYENFAPKAKKYVFDVDQAELNKLPDDWIKWKTDLNKEWPDLLDVIDANPEWMKWCKDLYNHFRFELDKENEYNTPISFINELSKYCKSDDVLAPGSSGGAAVSFMQCFKIKKGQRVTLVSTIGSMGADIPMAIGACFASGKRRTMCVTGDGGFILNVQELEVVTRYQLPIYFFVYNNNGYGSIRSMQTSRFNSHYVGCDPASGMTLPSIQEVANTFGIKYFKGYEFLNQNYGYHMNKKIEPIICEIQIDPEYKQYPRVMSQMDENGKFSWMSMEHMYPELDKKEFDQIMNY